MVIFTILVAIFFPLAGLSLMCAFILSVVLAPDFKQYDPSEYQTRYVFYAPTSIIKLYMYTRNQENYTKFPKKKRWLLTGIKYLMTTFIITMPLAFICALIINPS